MWSTGPSFPVQTGVTGWYSGMRSLSFCSIIYYGWSLQPLQDLPTRLQWSQISLPVSAMLRRSSQSSQSAPVPPSYTDEVLIHQPVLLPPILMFSSALGGESLSPCALLSSWPSAAPRTQTHLHLHNVPLQQHKHPEASTRRTWNRVQPIHKRSDDSCHQGLSRKQVKAADLWTQLVSTVLWRNHEQNHRSSRLPYSALTWD